MKITRGISTLVLLLPFAAIAADMSKEEFKASQQKVEADYKAGKVACELLQANKKDICLAQAKGRENVALADLDAQYQPTSKTQHDWLVAKAQAQYAVARERCDDLGGNKKDVCLKEASSVLVAGKADARVLMKIADAREEAMIEKRDAEYAVAIQKCDDVAGDARRNCVTDARVRFGKS